MIDITDQLEVNNLGAYYLGKGIKNLVTLENLTLKIRNRTYIGRSGFYYIFHGIQQLNHLKSLVLDLKGNRRYRFKELMAEISKMSRLQSFIIQATADFTPMEVNPIQWSTISPTART